MYMEIRFPEDFSDIGAIQDYFRINDKLAGRLISGRKWVRVKNRVGMKIMLDPRFNGTASREPGDIIDASWWLEV